MALVAAEMHTKQNSNASIVQGLKEQILVSSAFNHSILKKEKKEIQITTRCQCKAQKSCFVKFSISRKKSI